MGYRVIAPLVYLKVRDVGGSLVSYTYYAGAPVPEDVDQESLKHHLDSGLVVKDSDPIADLLGVPAGTPIPGDPPNVEVAAVPVQLSPEDKAEAVRQASSSRTKK